MFGLLRRSGKGLDEDLIDDGIDNYANSDNLDDKEKAILRHVDLIVSDPDTIDAAYYEELRQHLSDDEIVELGNFLLFNLGYHTFFGTLKFYPMFSPDGRLVSQEESERLYGAAPSSLQAQAAE